MKRLFLIVGLCLLPALGRAQVIVHQAALDQLAGIVPPPAAPVAPVPRIHRITRQVAPRRHLLAPSVVSFESPPPPATLAHKPAVPLPAIARPAPPAAVPAVARPAPPPAAPAAPAAVALHFAAGSAELPAGMTATLKPICAAAEPSGTVSINAGAPGIAGDPSVAMRLSMQRAFAVRDALAACGISPSRIVPRALGAAAGGNLDTTRVMVGP